ncbi:MAG: hypothetical protein JNM67_01905 [Bacteroidetes bacterium]|nr:hypothetical protein [Bacteroidota bacterium]
MENKFINKLILAALIINIKLTAAQNIITVQPATMIEKSIRPFVLLDTNVNCAAYKDSLYFQTINKNKILLDDIGIISHIANSNYLDSIIFKINEIQKPDTTSKKNIISIRVFECNTQVERIFLSKLETVILFKTILPYISDEKMKLIIENYLTSIQNMKE